VKCWNDLRWNSEFWISDFGRNVDVRFLVLIESMSKAVLF
jgi:hypothetical protein